MYRFKADYMSKIEPGLIDALTDFSGSGWRRVSAENVPPDIHVTRGFTGFSLLVRLICFLLIQQRYGEQKIPRSSKKSKKSICMHLK